MALKQTITYDYLKQHIGEQNIFTHYFGPFEFNKSYNSVLRQDDKKSTGFYITENNSIKYNDFATSEKLNFVQFVMKLFNINYPLALKQIAVDFGLIDGIVSSSKQAIIKPVKTPKKPQKRQLILKIQPYKNQHLKYWNHYHITPEELQKHNVYAVKSYTIDGYAVPLDNNIRFAYIIKDVDQDGEIVSYAKIYTPSATEYKWVTNCPLNAMFGFVELNFKTDTLFICKSQKERIIVNKLFNDCISLQSENKGSINPAHLAYLKTLYKRIIYFGDNDQPGLAFKEYIQQTYNIESYTFPQEFLTKYKIKDIADFVALWGVNMLKTYFKQIKIL